MAESYKFSHWGSTSEDILNAHFPLHRACRDGDVECLSRLLIEAQHGVYVEDNFYGWTPAHWAAYFGKLACLRKLMQVTRVGADCDVRSSRFSQTPAHLAAFGGHPQSLQWLVQSGASTDCQDYLGETPTHKAARTGSMECASLLVSHGAKLFIKNISGHTPADLADQCGHNECAVYLRTAAVSQENQPQGIYQQQNSTAAPLVPSPGDITTIDGGRLVNGDAGRHCNGINSMAPEECAMAEEAMDAAPLESATLHLCGPPAQTTTYHRVTAAGDSSSDVTINPAISNNQVPVAGVKRSREDTEEMSYKRPKITEAISMDISTCVSMETSPHIAMATEMSHAQTSSAMKIEDDSPHPYQTILALSCEPLKPLVRNEDNANNTHACQYWAFVV